jgi:hypothetical protein
MRALLFVIAAALALLAPIPALAQTYCSATQIYDANPVVSTSTKLIVAQTAGIYVCGYLLEGSGAGSVQLIYGQGAACETGTGVLTPKFTFGTVTNPPIVDQSPAWRGMFVPPGNDLCITATGPVQAIVYYRQ